MISLSLPFPISVNAMRTVSRASGRIVSSPAYRLWKREADAIFLTQKRKTGRIVGRFSVFITLDEGRKGRPDPDNHVKCVLDALQRWGVITNDNFCDEVHVGWGYAPEGCRVVLYEFSPRSSAGFGGSVPSDGEAIPSQKAWVGRR